MKFQGIVLLLSLSALAPAWAINKCTGPDGKVAYQDAPCAGKGETINVKPASGQSPVVKLGADGTLPMSEADRLNALTAESQRDRRKRDLKERLVPYAQSELVRHKYQCTQTQKDLEADQYAYRQNLYGKTHAAQIASEMAASAARCDTKDRELRENLETLRKECLALGCG